MEMSSALRLGDCAGRMAIGGGSGGRAVAALGGGFVLNSCGCDFGILTSFMGCGCGFEPLIKPAGSGFLNADDMASSKRGSD